MKTSTGFVKNGLGARTDFVRLMAQTVERRGMGVKASGGIKTRFQAKELIEAGATRLGTSSGVAIVSPQKMDKITIRSDRDTDYSFLYKGEETILKAGSVISIADGLEHVVLPTVAMKIMNNLIVIKEDVK